MSPIQIIGVLNLTPDSFSDGGRFTTADLAIKEATKLLEEGADIIELGADSTRPGSVCVGIEEEWTRLSPVLSELSGKCRLSIDTHHAEIARRASDFNISFINDITAGADKEMFRVVAPTTASIILMYSQAIYAHTFGAALRGDLIETILGFWRERVDSAYRAGISKERIVLDPGMGAFISDDASKSFELLNRFSELTKMELPLMLGVSRKGFWRAISDLSAQERDPLSALAALLIAQRLNGNNVLYIRTHNVRMQRDFFKAARMLCK